VDLQLASPAWGNGQNFCTSLVQPTAVLKAIYLFLLMMLMPARILQ